jgi:hypothetical protein
MRLRDDTNLMLMIACLIVNVILGVAAGVASSRIVSLVLLVAIAGISMSVMYLVRLRP